MGAAEADYLLCLLVFAASVVAYTAWGGFRAVVWTDMMQGVIMGLGVVILLGLALTQVGGIERDSGTLQTGAAARAKCDLGPTESASSLVLRPRNLAGNAAGGKAAAVCSPKRGR